MKNKLISLLAVPLVLAGLAGCFGAPIIKDEPIQKRPAPYRNLKIVSALVPSQEEKDCIELIIDLYYAHDSLQKLAKLEGYLLEELKRNPNSYLDEKILENNWEMKKVAIQHRNNLLKKIKDYKCLGNY